MSTQAKDAKLAQLQKIFPDQMSWDFIGSFQEFSWIKKKDLGFDFADPDVLSKMIDTMPADTDDLIRVMGNRDEGQAAEASAPARRKRTSRKEAPVSLSGAA